eukprot:CAMPEP_0201564688 /NCGR_PEP_ID=MMETSP0190_2-20130828/3214_1 /ASSEMBLY_ACC=CAM_ASM_000263 /TAXON_ID=37353 /ORGANISM="Rosalina sp." /LENGTH=153 /DNA_ID=CAMNT_0047981197 /DNA_START=104 /DNA_END=565 /DNA_ORIENTATION=-
MNSGLIFILISFIFFIPSFDASGSGSKSSSRGGRRMSRFDRDNGRSDYYTKNNNAGYSRYVDDKDKRYGRDGADKSDYTEKLLLAVLKENMDLSSRIDGLLYKIKGLKEDLKEAVDAQGNTNMRIGSAIADLRERVSTLEDDCCDGGMGTPAE